MLHQVLHLLMDIRVQEILSSGPLIMVTGTLIMWLEHRVPSLIGVMREVVEVLMEACKFMQHPCHQQFLRSIVGMVV